MSTLGFHGEQPSDAMTSGLSRRRRRRRVGLPNATNPASSLTPAQGSGFQPPALNRQPQPLYQPAPAVLRPQGEASNFQPSSTGLQPVNARRVTRSVRQQQQQQQQPQPTYTQPDTTEESRSALQRWKAQATTGSPALSRLPAKQQVREQPVAPIAPTPVDPQIQTELKSLRDELKQTTAHVQQLLMQQTQQDEKLKNFEVTLRSTLGTLDELKQQHDDVVSRTQLADMADNIRKSIQSAANTVSNNTYWCYGKTTRKTPMFETPSFKSRQQHTYNTGDRILLTMPMAQNAEGYWLKARRVTKQAEFVVGYVPVMAWSPEVIQAAAEAQTRPTDSDLVTYVGDFRFGAENSVV